MSANADVTNVLFALNECEVTALRPTSEMQLSNGVKNNVVREFPATSGISLSSMNFQVDVPQDHFLHPEVQIRIPAKIAVTIAHGATQPAAGGRNPFPDRLWGMSHMSFYHLIESMNVNINGITLSKRLSDIVPHLVKYEDMSADNPKLCDQYSTPDFVQQFGAVFDVNTIGGSPFSKIGDTAYSKYLPRTSVGAITGNADIGASATGTGNVDVEFIISLPFSLFSYAGSSVGISQIKTLGISLNLNAQHERLINRAPILNSTVSSVAMTLDATPVLTVTFLQPSDFVMAALRGPDGLMMPQTVAIADHVDFRGGDEKSIAGGASVTFSTASLGLSAIPKKIYICAMRNRSTGSMDNNVAMSADKVVATPCVYGMLSDVKIAFSGQNAAGYMKEYDLYSQSSRNGLSIPWAAAKLAGFVACYDLTKGDLGIQDAGIIGQSASVPLQVSCTVKNLDTVAHNYRLVVIIENESFLTINNGKASLRNSISLSDEQKKELLTAGVERIRSTAQVIGGSFLGTLWNIARKVAKTAVKHLPGVIETYKASGFQPATIGGTSTTLGYKPLGAGKKGGGVDSFTPATASKSRIL